MDSSMLVLESVLVLVLGPEPSERRRDWEEEGAFHPLRSSCQPLKVISRVCLPPGPV